MSLIHAWRPHLPRCQQDLCPRSAWKVGKQGGNAYGESQGCAECWPLSSKIFRTLTPSAPVKTRRYRAENSSQTPKKRQINNIYEIMWVFGQAPAVADEYDPFAEGFQWSDLLGPLDPWNPASRHGPSSTREGHCAPTFSGLKHVVNSWFKIQLLILKMSLISISIDIVAVLAGLNILRLHLR